MVRYDNQATNDDVNKCSMELKAGDKIGSTQLIVDEM